MGICHEKGGLTTQRKDITIREPVCLIVQSMSIRNKQGTDPDKWDLLIDYCLTGISDQASKTQFSKWCMADQTNLDGQKLEVTLNEFAEIGLYQSEIRINETSSNQRKFVHVRMYFFAPVLLLLLLKVCGYTRR